MRNLKDSWARKIQGLVSTHAALRNHKLQTVSTDNFIVQDSNKIYPIESLHKFGTIRLATRRPVSHYDL